VESDANRESDGDTRHDQSLRPVFRMIMSRINSRKESHEDLKDLRHNLNGLVNNCLASSLRNGERNQSCNDQVRIFEGGKKARFLHEASNSTE
jgi:hypothetical protein